MDTGKLNINSHSHTNASTNTHTQNTNAQSRSPMRACARIRYHMHLISTCSETTHGPSSGSQRRLVHAFGSTSWTTYTVHIHHIISAYRILSYRMIWYDMISYHIRYQIISYHIISSYKIRSYIKWYHIISIRSQIQTQTHICRDNNTNTDWGKKQQKWKCTLVHAT